MRSLDQLGDRLGLGGPGVPGALGRAGTASGHGMLLGNPHLPPTGRRQPVQADLDGIRLALE